MFGKFKVEWILLSKRNTTRTGHKHVEVLCSNSTTSSLVEQGLELSGGYKVEWTQASKRNATRTGHK